MQKALLQLEGELEKFKSTQSSNDAQLSQLQTALKQQESACSSLNDVLEGERSQWRQKEADFVLQIKTLKASLTTLEENQSVEVDQQSSELSLLKASLSDAQGQIRQLASEISKMTDEKIAVCTLIRIKI